MSSGSGKPTSETYAKLEQMAAPAVELLHWLERNAVEMPLWQERWQDFDKLCQAIYQAKNRQSEALK